MPSGKVKWYNPEKGFGFITQDEGDDVYLPESALPNGVTTIPSGRRVEFGMAEGKRGPQALSVQLIDPAPTVSSPKTTAHVRRRPAEELHGMVEDMIKLLESQVQPELRRGKYPENKSSVRIAGVLRAVARELDPKS